MSAARQFLFRTGKQLNDITWMEEGSAPPTTLKTGREVNVILKTLAGNTDDPEVDYNTKDTYVKSFKRSSTPPPNGVSTQNIATDDGPSVLAWFDSGSGTMNYYTPAKEIYTNSDCSDMFYYFDSLASLDIGDWNTSNTINMDSMFHWVPAKTIDVSNWDTSSVIYMSHMFDGSDIVTIDVSNWDVSSVRQATAVFQNCSKLVTVDVSNWNTSNMLYMEAMFGNCESLETVDVSNWDTSRALDLRLFFNSCKSLTAVDVSNWDTSRADNMNCMFMGCDKLTSIDVSNFDVSRVTDFSRMFSGCDLLTTIGDVSGWDTSNATSMINMFSDCSLLPAETFSQMDNWNISRVEITEDPTDFTDYGFHGMFRNCQATPNWPGTFNEDGTYILPEPIPETHILYDSGSNEFTQNPMILSGGTKYTSTEYANSKMTAYDVSGIKDTAPPLGFWRRMTSTGSGSASYQAYDGSLCLYFSEELLDNYNYLKLEIIKTNYGTWSGNMQAMDIVINDTITISKSNCSIVQDSSNAVFTYSLASIAALSESESAADTGDIEIQGIVSPKLPAQMLYANSVWLSLDA